MRDKIIEIVNQHKELELSTRVDMIDKLYDLFESYNEYYQVVYDDTHPERDIQEVTALIGTLEDAEKAMKGNEPLFLNEKLYIISHINKDYYNG